jgi:arylformamidase
MPLTATMGEARVIEIEHPREITAGELAGHGLRSVPDLELDPMLADPRDSSRISCTYRSKPPRIWPRPGCGPLPRRRGLVHRILLEAGIWIIEGPDLSPITGGRYEMICLPDGAPARAILRPLG